MRSLPARFILSLAAGALAVSSFAPVLAEHSTSSVALLAIDARPADNTATRLGRLDGCTSVAPGSLVTVDYVTTGIPEDRPLIGFEVEIQYNYRLLEVVAVDNEFLLAAEGEFEPIEFLSDDLPDSDGVLRVVVLDLASNTSPPLNVESGPGVLSRITFRAKARGVSTLSIGFRTKPDLLYPLLLDTQGEVMEIEALGTAYVVSGRPCPKVWPKPRILTLPPIEELTADAARFFGRASNYRAPPSF
jgi:hypothetical protein